jgi:predicted nucleic acid-binding protein
MTHGIDTDFLVAVEIIEHPGHLGANQLLDNLLLDGHQLALAPQTLAEFIHVVTDQKRMPEPLTMAEAVARAERWWEAQEVLRVYPDGIAVADFIEWLQLHRLGRKRVLDTLLAATLKQSGVTSLITNNHGDYRVFGHFKLVGFPLSA